MDIDLLEAIGGPSPEALDNLIYVVGSARGGTTLTKNVIGLHDGVISLSGPSHFLNHPWRHRRLLDERLWRVVFWLPSSVRRSVVRESLEGERKTAYVKHLNRVLQRKELRSLYQLYPLVRALDPEEPRNPRNVVAWLDKGNDFWGVDLLAKHFPKARFVFVVRDPRGSVASLAKRTADARPDTNLRIAAQDIVASSIYWRNLVQKELRFARRYPQRTIFFRYEDMVTRPLGIVPQLYDFLGLPAVPKSKLQDRLSDVTYGASLNSKERGRGLSSKPLERWRSVLSTEAVDLVSEICGDTASRLGYDLVSERNRGITKIASLMPEPAAQATAAAKLLYLGLREVQFGSVSPTFAPLSLLRAT